MATVANTRRDEPAQFEARGWAGLRRARLVVTPTHVIVITRDGRNEIARDAVRRVHCSSDLYDRIALSTDDRELVFRLSDVTPFALWARRNALAPRVDLDNDVGQAVKEAEADERDEQELRTGLDAQGRIKTANIAQRFFARIIDLIVIFVLALAISIASGSSDGAFVGFIFALMPAYEIPLVTFFGCTLGKLWPSRIRVVRVKTGRPPGLLHASVRTLLVWPLLLAGRLRWLIPGPALASLDTLHDRAAGTVVLPAAAIALLRARSPDERARLLRDAQQRQLAGLAGEEAELDSALSGGD